MKKVLLVIAILLLGLVGYRYAKQNLVKETEMSVTVDTVSATMKIGDGPVLKKDVEKGSTALDYLKAQAQVKMKGEGSSAYVTGINERDADEGKKEFWSFYVNGKMAEVGAGSYILKAGDIIEWKIENY